MRFHNLIVFLFLSIIYLKGSLYCQVTVSGGTLAIGTYTSLKTAIDSINNKPVTGNIIVNIDANFIDTISSKIILTATGNSSQSIKFQKSGTGLNPKLISYIGNASIPNSIGDGFFILSGSDYVTIDGLDLEERSTNTTPTTVMEFGYALMKTNGINGCQHNLIKNCNIALNRVQNSASGFNGSTGIVILNNTYTSIAIVSVTSNTGSNSFNKFYNNTINNCNNGFYFSGFSDTTFPFLFSDSGYGDSANEIGSDDVNEGNEILNFGGGGSNISYGIYSINQWALVCKNNTVNNNDGNGVNHVGTLRGIYLAGGIHSASNVKNNSIQLYSNASVGNFYGIECLAGNNGISNDVTIINNSIYLSSLLSSSSIVIGINHNSSVANATITNNNIRIFSNTNNVVSAITLNGNISNNIRIDSNLIDTLRFLFTGLSSTNRRLINVIGGSATTVKSINANIFNKIIFDSTGDTNGEVSYIYNSGEGLNTTISSNIASNNEIKTNGPLYLIYNSFSNNNAGLRTITGNFFENITKVGTGSNGIICYNDNNSFNVSNYFISSNIFKKINNGNSTGSVTGIRVQGTGTSVVFDIYNNQCKDFTSLGPVFGLNLNNIGGTNALSSKIRNNQFSKFTSNAVNSNCISLSTSITRLDIYENKFDTFSLNANGIGYVVQTNSTLANINIYKNKFSQLSNSHANGSITGINIVAGNLININNNLIANLKAENSNSNNAATAISLSNADSILLSNNTIFLNSTSNTSNVFGSHGLYVYSTISTLISRNNIIVNTSTPGPTGGFVSCMNFQNASALGDYNLSSNHNLFYAGLPATNKLIYGEGFTNTAANGKQRLQDFKAYAVGKDYYSVTENPTFISTNINDSNFLHINATTPTEIESGGIPIDGMNTDVDNQTRNINTPDIGADEGNFFSNDNTPPYIHPFILLHACDSLAYSFNVTISDYKSDIPTSGLGLPKLKWKLTSAGEWDSVTAIYVTDDTYSFTIPENVSNINDTIFYYLLAQDGAAPPNVISYPHNGISNYNYNPPSANTNPTNPLFYRRIDTLQGIYTVGLNGDFPTITAALSAYTFRCLKGPVEFHLIDSVYSSSTEIMPFNITQSLYSDASTPLTIRPADSTHVLIIGSSGSIGSALFQMSGADNITIDGSNDSIVNKSLTIKNTYSTNPVGIKVVSFQNNNSENIEIKNCNLKNSTNSGYGIHAGGTTINSGGFEIKNLRITNNEIDSVHQGITVLGLNTGKGDSIEIDNNKIQINSTASANGITISNIKNSNISANNLSINATGAISGLSLGIGVENTIINKNKIIGLHSSEDSVIGISINTGNIHHLSFVNNFIGGIKGIGNLYGINADIPSNLSSSNFKFYNNSIHLEDTVNVNNTITTAAIKVSQNISNLDLRNNILNNHLYNSSSSGSGSKHYSIFSNGASNSFSHIDYNLYSVAENQGRLGFINNADQATLQNLQNSFGQNQNSKNFKPTFISKLDLHLSDAQNYDIDNIGFTIPTITIDIDDELRNNTTPDIGADEFTTIPCNMANGGVIIPSIDSICFGEAYTITTTNSTSQPNIKYQWQQSYDGNVFYNLLESDTFRIYEVHYLLPNEYYYRLAVTCNVTHDTSYSNAFLLKVKTLPVIDIMQNDTILCRGNSTVLAAEGGISYTWSPLHPVNNANNSELTVQHEISEKYYVTGIDANGCSNIDSANVYVYNSPSIISIIPLQAVICKNDSTVLNAVVSSEYYYSTINFELKDTSGFLNGPVGDDVSTNAINLPFDFNFYGENYNQVYINTNGLISFSSISHSLNNPQTIPNGLSQNNYIALCWANLLANSGEIKYNTIGLAPNRIFVVDFDNVNFYSSIKEISGQIQLYETSNKIQLHLKKADSLNINKTIGIENQDGTNGLSPIFRNTTSYHYWKSENPEAYEFGQVISTYEWTPSNSLLNNTLQNPITTPLNETTEFNLTLTANSCIDNRTATISVRAEPEIIADPVSTKVCFGNEDSFQVLALGTDSILYQWYKDGIALSNSDSIMGATLSNLLLNSTDFNDVASYTVVISDCGIEVESKEAILDVIPLPTAILFPMDTVCVNNNLILNVTTDIGSDFIWIKNESVITDQINSQYNATSSGRYKAIVIDDQTGCSDSSSTLLLTVNPSFIPIILDPGTANLCENEILLLSANSGYSISFDTISSENIPSTTISPFKASFENSKTQYLYDSLDLTTMGLLPSSQITELGFILNDGITNDISNFNLNIGWVQVDNLGNQFKNFERIEVIEAINYNPAISSGNLIFPINHTLIWDGYSSLIVEICFEENNSTSDISIMSSSISNKCLVQSENNIENFCSQANEPLSLSLRPNLLIKHINKPDFIWAPSENLYSDADALNTYNGEFTDSLYIKGIEESEYTITARSALGCESFIDFNATITSNIVLSENDGDAYSLRKVMDCIENGDTINFGINVSEINMTDSLLINKDVFIKGNLENEITILFDLMNSGFINDSFGMKTAAGNVVKIENLKFKQINSLSNYTLFHNNANLKLRNCMFVGDTIPLIRNENGEVIIEGQVNIKSE